VAIISSTYLLIKARVDNSEYLYLQSNHTRTLQKEQETFVVYESFDIVL